MAKRDYSMRPLTICGSIIAAGMVLSGCGATDSNNVRTGGIRANLAVEAKGNGTTDVTATFTVGSGGLGATHLKLKSGDSAAASANGVRKTLRKETDALGGIHYETGFGFDDADTLFTISLDRPNDASAPDSWVRLPEKFEITLPVDNQRFTISDQLTIGWAPSGYSSAMKFNFTAKCPAGAPTTTRISNRSAADTGSFNPTIESIIGSAADDLPPGSACRVEMEIARSRSGVLDPGYGEGGLINAAHIRRKSFLVDAL